jgi:hypothetical protein
MQNHTNAAFVRTIRTKPVKTASKPAYTGKQWKRTDKRTNAAQAH